MGSIQLSCIWLVVLTAHRFTCMIELHCALILCHMRRNVSRRVLKVHTWLLVRICCSQLTEFKQHRVTA